jgi:uncharacterized membrane protein (UPF0127 family)
MALPFVLFLAWPLVEAADCDRWRAAGGSMGTAAITIETGGRSLPLRVKLADTSERQAAGFQCASVREIDTTLILFDFGREILTQFHMQNVPAPLDIAFVKADGRIFWVMRMDPSPTALYGPMGPFRWALEARAGFFEAHGIRAGSARLVAGRPGSTRTP